jgi:hypothetical protein
VLSSSWREIRDVEETISQLVSPFLFLDMQALLIMSLDAGTSGLPALFILEELLSRLAFDLKTDKELLPWRHFDMIIGTGPGG